MENQNQDVLFQKIGNRWYVFAEVDGETVFTPMPEDVDPKTTKLELYHIIEEHVQRMADIQKRRDNFAAA